ncbi:hypothetical protein K492DRAFT_200504 [Lichtheimia hyalospora FSU 10163]|nr:hypothetical protein K492DRAFT_200504 [Lichtheimia hyalospora FSU 10163]
MDENGEPAAPVSMRPQKRKTLLALLEDHPESYWWIDVLCARTDTPLGIMGDIYACCYLCYALVDCEIDLITQINSMARELYFDEDSPPWERDVYKEVYDVLTTFYQCNWWKRVWTWQEAALPDEVLFIAEAHSEISDDNMLNMCVLDKLTGDAWFVGVELMEGLDSDEEDDTDTELKVLGGSTSQEISWSRIYYRDHVTNCTVNTTPSSFRMLFEAFAQSPRQCMNPVDYVYGVLGIFQLDIPRKTDPNEVWQLFLSELRKLLTDPKRVKIRNEYDTKMIARISDDRLQKCNLLTAKSMGESSYDASSELILKNAYLIVT